MEKNDTVPVTLPRAVVEKLVEAKDWYEQRDVCCFGETDRARSDRAGASLLAEIVEVIDNTVGFAPVLGSGQ